MTTDQLHDDILSALPYEFVRRMRNWSRTVDGTPVSTSKLDDRVDHTRAENSMPLLLGEANDTHRAVQRLTQPYQDAVTVFWTYQAHTLSWMATATPILRAARLGPASFRSYLDGAHDMLERLFTAQREAFYARVAANQRRGR